MPFGGLLTLGAIGAGTSILGGIMGQNAAGKAADAQVAAANKVQGLTSSTVPQANDVLSKFYQDNLGMLQPYMQGGSTAESALTAGIVPGGQFNNGQPNADQVLAQDPGYQFRLQQGQLALDRSASSRGEALGGGQLKALTQYGQDYASGEYANAFNRYNTTQTNLFNRLNTVAGTGLNATSGAVGAGQQTGAEQSGNLLQGLGINANAITGGANATASGYVGGTNALIGGLNGASQGITQAALLQGLLSRNPANSPAATPQTI